MAPKAEDWVASLVESQLSSAIKWKLDRDLQRRQETLIKQEPDSDAESDASEDRFEDNGMDLKIHLHPNELKSFQLVKVLNLNASDAPLSCLMTDGFTEIRATFSDEAVASIENELERRVSLEDNGDVLSCTSATINATPYGIPACHVQLYVGHLDYDYHLRKSIGKGMPIHHREYIINAVKELARLQALESGYMDLDAETSDQDEPEEMSSPVLPSQTLIPGSSERPARRHIGSESSLQSQAIPATQLSPSKHAQGRAKRIRQPIFDREGREIVQGVNFQQPVSIGRATTKREPSPEDTRPRLVTRTTFTQLGNLLGKPQLSKSNAVPKEHDSEPSPSTNSVVDAKGSAPLQSEKPHVDRHTTNSNNERASEWSSNPTPASIRSTNTSSSPALSTDSRENLPQALFQYHRRKIPNDQQRLLESQSSWVPSLPGKQFPHPNVPIALLQKWNETASEPPAEKEKVAARSTQPSLPGALAADRDNDGSSFRAESDGRPVSDHAADEDSDEELSDDAWPATPSAAEMLPPDSSIGGPVPKATPSQQPPPASGDLELEVPRTLEDASMAHRKARSDHFRVQQRRGWITRNYTVTSIGQISLFKVVGNYRAAYPNDTPVHADDFASLIKDVFPNWGTASLNPQILPKAKFPPRNAPPPNAPTGPRLDRNNAQRPRAQFPSKGQPRTLPNIRRDRDDTSISRVDSYRPQNTDSLVTYQAGGTRGDHVKGQFPAARQKPEPASSPMPPAKRKIDTANPLGADKRPKAMDSGQNRTLPPQSSRPADGYPPTQSTQTKGRPYRSNPNDEAAKRKFAQNIDLGQAALLLPITGDGMTPFKEFVDAWKQLGSSGSDSRSHETNKERSARQLDVLSWRF